MKRQFHAAIVLSITIAFLTCLEQTKGEALADAHEPETGFSLKVESIPVGDFSKNPKSKMLVYDAGYFHRFAGKPERVNEQNGSEGGEAYLPPCGVYLPLSGYSPFPSSVSSLALGGQIVGLVLIGFCFAFLAVIGFYWIFDDPNRNRVFRGAGLAATGTVGCLFFYGWAFSAHPLATWGLC